MKYILIIAVTLVLGVLYMPDDKHPNIVGGYGSVVIGDNLTVNEPYIFATNVGRWKMTPEQSQQLRDLLVDIINDKNKIK